MKPSRRKVVTEFTSNRCDVRSRGGYKPIDEQSSLSGATSRSEVVTNSLACVASDDHY